MAKFVNTVTSVAAKNCLIALEVIKIPLVYNTSGYELAEIIRVLDGVIDVYLADMRYADNLIAEELSSAIKPTLN